MNIYKAYGMAAAIGIVMIGFLIAVMYEAQKVMAG